MYDKINGRQSFAQKGLNNLILEDDGMNVSELPREAKETLRNCVLSGKAKHDPECEDKKHSNARFKYAVRFMKRNERATAEKIQHNNLEFC